MQYTSSGHTGLRRLLHRGLFGGCASLLAILAVACGGTTVEIDKGKSGAGGSDTTAGVGGATGDPTSTSGSGGSVVDACGPIGEIGSIDLGEINLKFGKPFTICENTVGFTALVAAPSKQDVIGVSRIRTPELNSVLSNFAMAGHTTGVFANYGWVLASNPQSNSADSFPVQPGKWQITLGDDDGSLTTAATSVWYRRTSDGLFHGGVIDVNVFIAPGAATQDYVNTVLSKMFPFGGVDLGTIVFYPLDLSYSTVSSQDELATMLQESAGLTAMPALNLFVVGNFGSAFGDAIGIAGGIPGSPMQHGNARSGVAYQPSGDTTYDASVLRHETGHVAGLFHTTEYSIDETDPLDDTPSCPQSKIQSDPQTCPDTTNEMFPIAFGSMSFTDHQDLVIQGSMLYRGIIEEGGIPVPAQPVTPPTGAAELIALGPETAADIAQMEIAHRPQKVSRAPADSLERVLASVWCARAGIDYTDLAVRIAEGSSVASPSARLRRVALDESAAELVRARALKAYVRAAAKAGSPAALRSALDLASAFASDEAASTDLRVMALHALASHDPAAAILAKSAASKTTDPIVRAAAKELPLAAASPSSGLTSPAGGAAVPPAKGARSP